MSDLNIKSSFLLLFSSLSLFFGCKKETIELSWEELNSNTNITLTSVHFTDENFGHIVGGSTWFTGSHIQTIDGGTNWSENEISNKQLFSLHFNENGVANTVGIDGYLFSNNNPLIEDWNFHRMPRWDILRDVSFNSRNEGVLVGGVAFAKGAIMVVDTNYTVPYIDTFSNQLNAVCYSDDNTIHVGGYGILLRSTDGGMNWEESSISGDFYQAIAFPTSTIGYVIGYNGTILKTTDNGVSWKYLRDGDELSVSDQPFLNLHFEDELNGFIVGEKGLCWKTDDGGENWKIVDGLPGFDFYDIDVVGDVAYIVGEDGRILKLIL